MVDLAGRLVIYNNEFAVNEHRVLMSFPYFKETPSFQPGLGFFFLIQCYTTAPQL